MARVIRVETRGTLNATGMAAGQRLKCADASSGGPADVAHGAGWWANMKATRPVETGTKLVLFGFEVPRRALRQSRAGVSAGRSVAWLCDAATGHGDDQRVAWMC